MHPFDPWCPDHLAIVVDLSARCPQSKVGDNKRNNYDSGGTNQIAIVEKLAHIECIPLYAGGWGCNWLEHRLGLSRGVLEGNPLLLYLFIRRSIFYKNSCNTSTIILVTAPELGRWDKIGGIRWRSNLLYKKQTVVPYLEYFLGLKK